MRQWLLPGLAFLCGLVAGPLHAQIDRNGSPIGFVPASRVAQAKAEAHALSVPSPEKAKAWLRALTEEPHIAGTTADYETAIDVRDKLRSWGWDADLAEYEVLLNYPKGTPVLEIVRPNAVKLKVTEEPNPADKDSASPTASPAFHGYGVSGNVTGQIIYANYGRPDDFSTLEKLGIEVKGKIVLVRYGEIFRGLKVMNAQKRGALGILIYSDPADDGYARGDVYPQGPFRPGSAIQRGSVQFLSLGPGDPSTPNGASVKDAKRLPIDDHHGFPLHNANVTPDKVAAWEKETGLKREDYFASIPSLPISYDSAKPMLEGLAGPNVPAGWQGGLPLAYHVGPGPVEVHFSIAMDYKIRTIWNVIGTLKGNVESDRWVMIGNHRDAWVYGAVDPSSGTAATLEMCRALGSAVKNGWKPRRTLVYASWDAEEYGLVGSTEWADEHAKEITDKAVMMLNVDSAVSGPELDLDGVPSLRDLVLEAAAGVTDLRSGKSLRDVWTAKQRAAWASTAQVDLDPIVETNGAPPKREKPFSPRMNALGSGSDYTAFLDHLGVPAIDVGFVGRYGVYHSIYDNFFWMEKFGDPEFLTHATAAKLYTLIVMRAASAEVVPLHFAPYGEALHDYLDDLRRIVIRKDRMSEKPFTFGGLAALQTSITNFQTKAVALDRATELLATKDGLTSARLAKVNDALTRVERAFLLPSGLPGRSWFKHSIYAPGLTTGYASWPLPGVRQAILDGDSEMLGAQVPALIGRINAASDALKVAIDAAEGTTPPVEPVPVPETPDKE